MTLPDAAASWDRIIADGEAEITRRTESVNAAKNALRVAIGDGEAGRLPDGGVWSNRLVRRKGYRGRAIRSTHLAPARPARRRGPMMAGELLPISKRIQTTRELLDKMKPALAAALPKHLGAERMARVVLTEVLASVQRARAGTPTLLDCTPESFAGAVLQCAALGLEPGVLGQMYLIPFRNTKRGTVECQVIAGYKGLLVLARRSGQILTIDPVIVHARDRFHVERGTTPKITHRPHTPTAAEPDAGEPIAYYAVAVIRGAARNSSMRGSPRSRRIAIASRGPPTRGRG